MKNTREEQIELINAEHDGLDIERQTIGTDEPWSDKNTPKLSGWWDFGLIRYRVKPQVFEAYLCGRSLCLSCVTATKCIDVKLVKLQVIK